MSGWTADLYGKLAEVSLEDPRSFAYSVLRLVRDQLDLVACSFYIYTPENRTLRLRAQVGLEYAQYESFELPLDTFPGAAIQLRSPVSSDDPTGSSLFRDKRLLDTLGAAGIVAAPLVLAEEAERARRLVQAPNPIGAICLYPRVSEQLELVERWATEYGPFLARLYLATLERDAMSFRRATVEKVAYRRDVGSLAYSFLQLVREQVSVEAASLWTFDARRRLLYLRKSSGLASERTERDIRALSEAESHPVADCFRTGVTALHTVERPLLRSEHVVERLASPLRSAAVVPVLLPTQARLRGRSPGAAGVLVLLNRFMDVGRGVSHPTQFTWEDRYLAEFGCELLSVLLYQVLRTQDYESDFERKMHGAQRNLQAARSNLQSIEQVRVERHLPEAYRYLVPNAIEWLEDLEAQIQRDEFVGKRSIEIEEISLYGDVLAKLEPMARRMSTRGRGRFVLAGLDDLSQSYRALPRVWGDTMALNCIFRNLLDNSLKYCTTEDDQQAVVSVSTETRRAENEVTVILEDNGIGIPHKEHELVFEDGFRGDRARGLQPQGLGRGLYECRLLLRRMKGDIRVRDSDAGTCFEISLTAARQTVPRT